MSDHKQTAVSRDELLAMLPDLDVVEVVDTLPEPSESREEQLETMRALVQKHEDETLHQVEAPDLERTLESLRSIRDSNIQDLFYIDEHGHERNHRISDLPESVAKSISSVKVTQVKPARLKPGSTETLYDADGEEVMVVEQTTQIEIKFWDKNNANDKLMRYHGAYKKDNEQVQPTTGEDMLTLLVDMAGAAGLPQPENNDA